MDFIEAEEIACDFIRKKVEAQKEYSYMTDSFWLSPQSFLIRL